MPGWPSSDRAAVYLPSPAPPVGLAAPERRVRLASARLRENLPVSDAILDEILDAEPSSAGIYTASERRELHRDRELVAAAREVLAGADPLLGQLQTCWLDGRRGVRVLLTDRLDRYRQLLADRVGADRVRVELTALSAHEVEILQSRLGADRDELADQGIFPARAGTGIDGFEIAYVAWDPEAAEQALRRRYGAAVTLRHLGATLDTFSQLAFGSWLAEADRLHVFYGLPRNGEQPAGCQVLENDRSVLVALSISDWRGAKTLVGGFTPSHATVQLRRPLGRRVVIDHSANAVRPHWTRV